MRMSSYVHANTCRNSFSNVTIANFCSGCISLATWTSLVSSSVLDLLLPVVMLLPIVIPPFPALGPLVLGAFPRSRPYLAPLRPFPIAQYICIWGYRMNERMNESTKQTETKMRERSHAWRDAGVRIHAKFEEALFPQSRTRGRRRRRTKLQKQQQQQKKKK